MRETLVAWTPGGAGAAGHFGGSHRRSSFTWTPLICLSISLLMSWGCRPADPPPAEEVAEEVAEAPTADPARVPEIVGEEVEYEVDGTPLTGYLAYDIGQEGTRPGVLVVHEWWGHNDYARQRARMLAEMGYTAFALDMYGTGKLASHPDEAQAFMTEILNQLEVGEERFEAAARILSEHPTTTGQLAAIGYCFGGGVVLHMARTGAQLAAVASFHGGLGPTVPVEPGTIQARLLVLNGNDDPMAPTEQVAAFESEMEAAGADLTLIGYDGAKHSFTNPGATEVGLEFSMPLEYNQAADTQSWAELESFLAETFASTPETG